MILYAALIGILSLNHIRAANVPATSAPTVSSTSSQTTDTTTPIVTLSLESLKNLSNTPIVSNAIPNVGVPTPSPAAPVPANASLTGGVGGASASDGATVNRDLSELKRRLDEDELKITRYIELTNILRDRYQELKAQVSSLVSGASLPLPTNPNPALAYAPFSSSNSSIGGSSAPNSGVPFNTYNQQQPYIGYTQPFISQGTPLSQQQSGGGTRNQGYPAPYPQGQAYPPSPSYAPRQLPPYSGAYGQQQPYPPQPYVPQQAYQPPYPQQQAYAPQQPSSYQQPPYQQSGGYSDPNYNTFNPQSQSQLGYQSNYANLPAYVPNPQAGRSAPLPGYYDPNMPIPPIVYPQNGQSNDQYAVPLVNPQTGMPLPPQVPGVTGGPIPTPFDTFNGGNSGLPTIPSANMSGNMSGVLTGIQNALPTNGSALPSTANFVNGLTSQIPGQGALPTTGSSLLSNFFGNTSPAASTNPANSSASATSASDVSSAQANPAFSTSSSTFNTSTGTLNTQATLPSVGTLPSVASTQISSTQAPLASVQAPPIQAPPIQASPIQVTPTVTTTSGASSSGTVSTISNTAASSTQPATTGSTATMAAASSSSQTAATATQQVAATVQTLQQQLQARETASATAATTATTASTAASSTAVSVTTGTAATSTTVAQPR